MPADVLDSPDTRPAEIQDWADGARRRPLLVRVIVALVAFLVVGNGLIFGSTLFFRYAAPTAAAQAEGIDHVHPVDDKVIRGAAPTEAGLRDLAAAGVTTVIDLRAEADDGPREELLAELGIERFDLPIRDGQLPTEAQAAQLLQIIADAPGKVFLHCGAGVGRTGAMTAWYLNVTGQASGAQALLRNLAVGPPSLEQIAFAVSTAGGEYRRPGIGVTALSRVLDAPRRIWHNIT